MNEVILQQANKFVDQTRKRIIENVVINRENIDVSVIDRYKTAGCMVADDQNSIYFEYLNTIYKVKENKISNTFKSETDLSYLESVLFHHNEIRYIIFIARKQILYFDNKLQLQKQYEIEEIKGDYIDSKNQGNHVFVQTNDNDTLNLYKIDLSTGKVIIDTHKNFKKIYLLNNYEISVNNENKFAIKKQNEEIIFNEDDILYDINYELNLVIIGDTINNIIYIYKLLKNNLLLIKTTAVFEVSAINSLNIFNLKTSDKNELVLCLGYKMKANFYSLETFSSIFEINSCQKRTMCEMNNKLLLHNKNDFLIQYYDFEYESLINSIQYSNLVCLNPNQIIYELKCVDSLLYIRLINGVKFILDLNQMLIKNIYSCKNNVFDDWLSRADNLDVDKLYEFAYSNKKMAFTQSINSCEHEVFCHYYDIWSNYILNENLLVYQKDGILIRKIHHNLNEGFLLDDKTMITISHNILNLYDLQDMSKGFSELDIFEIKSIEKIRNHSMFSAFFEKDNNLLIIGTNKGSIHFFYIINNKIQFIKSINVLPKEEHIYSLSFDYAREILILGTELNKLAIFSLDLKNLEMNFLINIYFGSSKERKDNNINIFMESFDKHFYLHKNTTTLYNIVFKNNKKEVEICELNDFMEKSCVLFTEIVNNHKKAIAVDKIKKHIKSIQVETKCIKLIGQNKEAVYD